MGEYTISATVEQEAILAREVANLVGAPIPDPVDGGPVPNPIPITKAELVQQNFDRYVAGKDGSQITSIARTLTAEEAEKVAEDRRTAIRAEPE